MLLLMFYENYMITVTLYVLWFLHSIKYHNQVDRYEIFMSQKRLTSFLYYVDALITESLPILYWT
jgi:hypothetical protein